MTAPFSVEILDKKHNKINFNCGVEALNLYLKTQASQDAKRFVAKVYVCLSPLSQTIIGFYTLSATRIDLSHLPEELIKKLPHYPYVPAILLGRLAFDKNHQKKKLGRLLLLDALYKSYQNNMAAMAVIVDAKDEKAKNFYRTYDFIEFKHDTHKLFLPMQKVKDLFNGN